MSDRFVQISDAEIRALYDWHKSNQWEHSGREEYNDAEYHKSRSKQLLDILEKPKT